MKTCIGCLIEKELEEFGKDSRTQNGYRPTCKLCRNARQRVKYRESDKTKEYIREWRAKNKKKVKRYNKLWEAANPEYHRRWKHAHKGIKNENV